jgi:ribosomal protein S17
MVRKKTFKKFFVHDEENVSRINDIVRIRPSRRHSKHKHFELHEIIVKDPKLEDYE